MKNLFNYINEKFIINKDTISTMGMFTKCDDKINSLTELKNYYPIIFTNELIEKLKSYLIHFPLYIWVLDSRQEKPNNIKHSQYLGDLTQQYYDRFNINRDKNKLIKEINTENCIVTITYLNIVILPKSQKIENEDLKHKIFIILQDNIKNKKELN